MDINPTHLRQLMRDVEQAVTDLREKREALEEAIRAVAVLDREDRQAYSEPARRLPLIRSG